MGLPRLEKRDLRSKMPGAPRDEGAARPYCTELRDPPISKRLPRIPDQTHSPPPVASLEASVDDINVHSGKVLPGAVASSAPSSMHVILNPRLASGRVAFPVAQPTSNKRSPGFNLSLGLNHRTILPGNPDVPADKYSRLVQMTRAIYIIILRVHNASYRYLPNNLLNLGRNAGPTEPIMDGLI